MNLAAIAALAAAALFCIFLMGAVLVWRLRSDREDGAGVSRDLRRPAVARELSSAGSRAAEHTPSIEVLSRSSADASPAPSSILTRLIGQLAPELSTLSSLAQVSASLKDADGQPLPQEEQLAAMARVLDELAASQPDSRMLQSMREAVAGARAGAHGVSMESPIQIFQSGTATRFLVNGVEYGDVDQIPDPVLREEARKMKDL